MVNGNQNHNLVLIGYYIVNRLPSFFWAEFIGLNTTHGFAFTTKLRISRFSFSLYSCMLTYVFIYLFFSLNWTSWNDLNHSLNTSINKTCWDLGGVYEFLSEWMQSTNSNSLYRAVHRFACIFSVALSNSFNSSKKLLNENKKLLEVVCVTCDTHCCPVKFSFIYTEPNHNGSHLRELHVERSLTISYKQALSDCCEENHAAPEPEVPAERYGVRVNYRRDRS